MTDVVTPDAQDTCSGDEDCPAGDKPFCQQNRCVPCKEIADGCKTRHPDRPVCADSGACGGPKPQSSSR